MVKRVGRLCLIFILALFTIGLSACTKAKDFFAPGVVLHLTSEFHPMEVNDSQDLFLEGRDKLVTSLKENVGIEYMTNNSLRDYSRAIINTNNLPEGIYIDDAYDEEHNLIYCYFVYEKFIDGTNISYLATTHRGAFSYYLIQFACESKNFPKYESLFHQWASQVEVS
ncbi:MAG: hypothetical protein LBV55_03695 [Acholeplasmatales bacterium]|jgi:hypothetical protein|nr:hypothetical protein [Acholeplasmatales bacterium]